MRAKHVFVLTTTESRTKIWRQKNSLKPLSIFAIILKRKGELVALFLMSYGCLVIVKVLWLFLTVPWVGLQCLRRYVMSYTDPHFLLKMFQKCNFN